LKVRARTLVAAPGLIERPYVFEGNDLPGVMLMTGARRLINRYAVRPGRRAVVFTANAHGDAGIEDLKRAGVNVVAVVDGRSGQDPKSTRLNSSHVSISYAVICLKKKKRCK